MERRLRISVSWRASGNAKAQFDLGAMYEHGQDSPQNDAGAAKWIRLSAQQSFAPAQFLFGLMAELGDGVHGNRRMQLWHFTGRQ